MNHNQIDQCNHFIAFHLEIHMGNFFSSLDDMHRAEMALKEQDPHTFACYCSDLFEEHGSNGITLPAVDRAVMLLRMLGREIE